ncbi:class A beta-lactamase-related serine hydrolase [Sporolactobacillus sp. CPB3-1]|uniref:Class A beta-lactamase-related serine hydrolase n=1 Tax=Sporolactobacillus mangiferae TaxID=2940498 RepID=A0ABT0MD10_9BACL|nr:serine hydrolase [Sporolactobacillus mangiferae]MCL1632748.1 class A beta-lactamase-related serine hydrolase [Sporolactobacillus mangiferae]
MTQTAKSLKLLICLMLATFWLLSGFAIDLMPAYVQPKLSHSAGTSIEAYIKSQGGEVTLVYHDLITGEEYLINPDRARRAASTIKLPLVMQVMDLISRHRLDPDEKLAYHGYQYNGGSGVIQYQRVGTRFTICDLIQKAVIYSDNIAFVMLRDRVGKASFIQYIKNIGGQYAYPGGANVTSARDLSTYAERLYNDAKTDANARQLIDYLKHTKYNETIPAGIKEVPVAHKAGWMPELGVSNDVAIVYDRHPYTLAIMTNGYSYSQSQTVIAHVASLVNKYHKQKYQ